MKKLTLNHELTPPELLDINQELESLLLSEELSEQRLLELVEQRDKFINAHLNLLSEESRKQFAEAELPVNEQLKGTTQALLKTSLQQLSGLVRGRKAVEKYK